jgi:hypothetical protein
VHLGTPSHQFGPSSIGRKVHSFGNLPAVTHPLFLFAMEFRKVMDIEVAV